MAYAQDDCCSAVSGVGTVTVAKVQSKSAKAERQSNNQTAYALDGCCSETSDVCPVKFNQTAFALDGCGSKTSDVCPITVTNV